MLQCKNLLGGGTTTSIVNYEELANILNRKMVNREGGNNQRLAIMLGMLTKDTKNPVKANIPDKDRSNFSQEQWKFMLDAPFEISNRCCNVMKKEPAHSYYKKTKRTPITAQMASESRLRMQKWLEHGCNGFDLKVPTSNPMAFWTEQDVLQYIYQTDLPICCVYGDVIKADNQTTFDFCEKDIPCKFKTTGCDRTGCVLCGFGCHLEPKGQGRFVRLKETHPRFYNLLDYCKNNGVTYREAIEWFNEHSNKKIDL